MRRLARPLLYVGSVVIVLGLAKYHAAFIGHYVFHTSARLEWTLVYAGVLWLAAYAFGLPDLDRRRNAWGPCLAAAVSAAIVISVVQLVDGTQLLPRFVVFVSVLLITPWFAVCVGLADIGRARDEERDRVVVVAGPDEQAALRAELDGDLEHPAIVVATLTPEEARSENPTVKPLINSVLDSRGTVIVIDRSGVLDETIVEQAAELHVSGLRVRSLSVFYDEWLGKLPMSELERMSLMFDVSELHRVRYGRFKRLVDLAVGIVGGAAFTVVMPFVLLGNAVANRGSLFFRQERVGRDSRTFMILKFRTMRSGNEEVWTAEDDHRITGFGRLLRRSHLDELPQVVNVLRGDLSIVGPRPEQTRYVRELRSKIPFYDLRHLVRPGLTGWAQVKYGYGGHELGTLEKLQYDFYYLRHQRLSLDLRIIGRTFRSVVGRYGR